ncbi:MAG TPA: VOC family protein [Gaiellaceae bacterium]|nr:VOC family protein [Gaiellaceae bacterium]
MALRRMDNVGIVVDDLTAAIEFFRELGLELEGRAMVEGEWAGRVTGLGDQRVEIAMMRTPDGHSRLELSRFLAPPVVADHRNAPVNALGYLRVMFAVDDIDETISRLVERGAQLVSSEVVRYEDAYRLCYIRGPGDFSSGSLKSSAERYGRGASTPSLPGTRGGGGSMLQPFPAVAQRTRVRMRIPRKTLCALWTTMPIQALRYRFAG